MNSTFYGLTGNATLKKGPDGITRWVFEINATGLIPQKYFVDVSAGDPYSVLCWEEHFISRHKDIRTSTDSLFIEGAVSWAIGKNAIRF